MIGAHLSLLANHLIFFTLFVVVLLIVIVLVIVFYRRSLWQGIRLGFGVVLLSILWSMR